MPTNSHWDRWLAESDSTNALAPEGYDDDAKSTFALQLYQRFVDVLPAYDVMLGTPSLYQDSTGLAHYRVTVKGKNGFSDATLAWVVPSHFGDLATVRDCVNQELLAQISGVLEEAGLRYIPYEYAEGKVYEGKCKVLAGFSWANRYFSMVPHFHFEASDSE